MAICFCLRLYARALSVSTREINREGKSSKIHFKTPKEVVTASPVHWRKPAIITEAQGSASAQPCFCGHRVDKDAFAAQR